MNMNKGCHKHHHEEFKQQVNNHRFWMRQLDKFNNKHRKFSRRVFLTFGLFTIITLFTANIIVSGVFSFIRYNHQKVVVSKTIEDISLFIDSNTKAENKKYLETLIYQDIFTKLVDIDNKETIFDTYTGFWEVNKNQNSLLSAISREIQITEKYKLYILKDLRAEQKLIRNYILIMLFINLIFVAMIMRASKFLTFRLLMPINHIIKTAENIDANNLSQRVPIIPLDDEVGRLSRVINNMIDRFETSYNAQKQFVSDASHELRTPLQIIKGYTDLAITKSDNKDILNEALTNVKDEIENMINLTETLLFLAKSEGQNINLNFEDISLNQLFTRIKNDLFLTNTDFEFNIPDDTNIKIFADEKLILQAFRAVIDNGIKYSSKEKVITIDYSVSSEETTVIITDKGSGIPEESLNKIFDRFYRVDEARSKEINGAGLGLAIVKNIIDLHNGKIAIESKINEGTSIIFTLPNNEFNK